MMKMILFSSLLCLTNCATSKTDDLLGLNAAELSPENDIREPSRYPVYLFPHTNALGDHVSGTWIRISETQK